MNETAKPSTPPEAERDSVLRLLQRSIRPERTLEILADLIRFKSVNPGGTEGEAAAYIAKTMESAGCVVELQEIEPGRPNVLARLKGTGGGRTVILNTHMDVVPAGAGWSEDPFEMVVKGDRAYGRGVMDAKGPLAAMMAAVEAIAASGIELPGDVVLAAVVDEEAASIGARRLPEGLTGDLAVVGEATNGQLAIAHRGSVRPVLVADGVSAHSSTPHLGVNAVMLMARALVALDDFAGKTLPGRLHPLTGQSTLSVTVMRGGIKESMIPDRCEALIDRRLIPGEDEEAALREIEQVISGVPELDGRVRIDRLVPTTGVASETAPDHPMVGLASRAIEEVYGRRPELVGLTANCDMTHFVARGIPSVIYGPGDFSVAHTADEWVPLSELEKATRVYATIALDVASS
ncbi:M20 family metallopeptidase [Cohnella thailandensis]|uniref:M20 family metallopeptidase n=1 Tax=Cohnella thailandensis TaxID=557557 RepID=A0A841SZV8_9BACL|nr:M20 family metallopeptidase [Cohnella thailandensis]MBB6636389.1 M20 family metallopeptidase [Cohnella thailandensis]MBP1973641.1 acetylornithine deacetylase/succinyl-diaminopimelate desuccinylase family protein [Cohnella thailandensis]